MERKPAHRLVYIRPLIAESTIPPPDGPCNPAYPQVHEFTDARKERRRRYTRMLPRVEKAFGFALRRSLYRLAEHYDLEYSACRERAREYLELEWRKDLERAAKAA